MLGSGGGNNHIVMHFGIHMQLLIVVGKDKPEIAVDGTGLVFAPAFPIVGAEASAVLRVSSILNAIQCDIAVVKADLTDHVLSLLCAGADDTNSQQRSNEQQACNYSFHFVMYLHMILHGA